LKPAYDKLIPALKNLLPAKRLDELGRVVTFIRRLREIQASAFVWCVVLSRFGSGRPGFEQARQWYERLTKVRLWPRPFQMRFKQASAIWSLSYAACCWVLQAKKPVTPFSATTSC